MLFMVPSNRDEYFLDHINCEWILKGKPFDTNIWHESMEFS